MNWFMKYLMRYSFFITNKLLEALLYTMDILMQTLLIKNDRNN